MLDTPQSRRQRLLLVVASLLCALGGGALAAVMLIPGPIQVRASTVGLERVAVFYERPAAKVILEKDVWLSFAEPGRFSKVLVEMGDTVKKGQILAELVIPKKVARQIGIFERKIQDLGARYLETSQKLDSLYRKRGVIVEDRTVADRQMTEVLTPAVDRSSGVAQEQDSWKRNRVRANQKLSTLARQQRHEEEARRKVALELQKAKVGLRALQEGIAGKLLRAPFSGVVSEIRLRRDRRLLHADEPVVRLIDPTILEITFRLRSAPSARVGSEAYVTFRDHEPRRARVTSVHETANETVVMATIVDGAGALDLRRPADYQLIRKFVDAGRRVPSGAVFQDADGMYGIVVVEAGKASIRLVDILKRDSESVVVFPSTVPVGKDDLIVVQAQGEADLGAVRDGDELELVP